MGSSGLLTKRRLALLTLLLTALWAPTSARAGGEPAEVLVATDKDLYLVGETVETRVYMDPNITCLCLEHEWAVEVVGEDGVVERWSWMARGDEEGYVKGLDRVRVEAPRVIEPGREYVLAYRVSVDRSELEKLLWVLGQMCRLLCKLPQTRPYMPSLLCRVCGAEKLYFGVYGGLRAYAQTPDGDWSFAVFIALGLQRIYYSVPAEGSLYLTASEVAEVLSLHYVITGLPPLSLEDLESRGAPYSLKLTPVGRPHVDLAGAHGSLVLRYRVELVPNEEYASLFDLYGGRAVYNSTNYADDLVSRANATLAALQALEAGACDECERELESCRRRVGELEEEFEALKEENSALKSEVTSLRNTVNGLRGVIATLEGQVTTLRRELSQAVETLDAAKRGLAELPKPTSGVAS